MISQTIPSYKRAVLRMGLWKAVGPMRKDPVILWQFLLWTQERKIAVRKAALTWLSSALETGNIRTLESVRF